jgi:hypothetical protein
MQFLKRTKNINFFPSEYGCTCASVNSSIVDIDVYERDVRGVRV